MQIKSGFLFSISNFTDLWFETGIVDALVYFNFTVRIQKAVGSGASNSDTTRTLDVNATSLCAPRILYENGKHVTSFYYFPNIWLVIFLNMEL